MKTSLKWLSEYVDIPWDASELADRLTLAGLEVEGIDQIGSVPQTVVVGQVLSRGKHPDADRLSVCRVDVGQNEPLQIVCGAPNCDPGLKAPVALIGTVLGEGFKIKKTKLRGVESVGMLCAEDELGLGTDHAGIMAMPEDAELGRPVSDYLDSDVVIDWEITPNRPDWLSHLGIAREIAAIAGKPESLRLPETGCKATTDARAQDVATVRVDDPELCPRYTARVIRSVTIGPSPDWMQRALEAVGMRPINNVVDITNYVMLECGQPLHAFDYERLADHTIVVRRAAVGEKLVTLDNEDHELTTDNLLIADPARGVALAGVMGGENSEISDGTTTVLLESAAFNPSNIRATAKQLGTGTESSYRFERGVGLDMVEFASARAAYLMAEFAGGEVLDGVIDVYPEPYQPHEVACRVKRAEKLIGVPLTADQIAGYMAKLALDVAETTPERVTVSVPSFRLDLDREADLIEEIARLYGYDNLPAVPAPARVLGSIRADAHTGVEEARTELLGLGLSETVTYSLMGTTDAALGTGVADNDLIKLANPISAEGACLRASLVSGLLRTVAHNIARNVPDLAVFEIGRVAVNAPPLPEERLQVGIALTGRRHPERYGAERELICDFFDLKGLLESWLNSRRLPVPECHPIDHPALKTGTAAELSIDAQQIAVFGQAADELTDGMRLTQPLYIAIVELSRMLERPPEPRKFQPLPQFPATARDISLVAPTTLASGEIIDAIRNTQSPWLENIRVFDLFEDQQALGKTNRSLAFSLTYRSSERTLTDEEVNQAHNRIKTSLANQLKISFR